MSEYKHWCGNCQIRVYIQRHYGNTLNWQDCPYTCEYATAMRCSTEAKGETMSDCMTFPDTVEEFMEHYKIVDTEQVYTNGAELVPIFRMRQWFEHLPSAQRTGRWIKNDNGTYSCDQCHSWIPNEQHYYARYCIFCGARMKGETDDKR